MSNFLVAGDLSSCFCSRSSMVMLGSVYSLIAIGYTLVFGVLNLLHMAHGEVFMVGAFIGLYVILFWNVHLVVGLFADDGLQPDPANPFQPPPQRRYLDKEDIRDTDFDSALPKARIGFLEESDLFFRKRD